MLKLNPNENLLCLFFHRSKIIRTDWYREESDIEVIRGDCRERILFFEKREAYLFQEPQIDHEPHLERMRVRLTFKPSETNAS